MTSLLTITMNCQKLISIQCMVWENN